MRSATALFTVLGVSILSMSVPAAAQEQPPPSEQRRTVDVDRLPLNLNRIQRELKHAADLEQRDGLNLRYVIHIYGAAPALELFNDESNLVNGPVPYGAPTHRELINHVTPQEFRAPAADFSALIRWLADRNKSKEKSKR
jgi:hypothetical protein